MNLEGCPMRSKFAAFAVVVLSLLSATFAVSAQAATKTGVQLSEEAGKPPTPVGAATETDLLVGPGEGENAECRLLSQGPLKSNGKAKDKIVAEPTSNGCFVKRLTVSGGVTGIQVSASALIVKAKYTIKDEGCAYAFKGGTLPLTLPGLVFGFGEITGKRIKKESAPGCAAEVKWEWEVSAALRTETEDKTFYAEVS
jgi:hypothetical protein